MQRVITFVTTLFIFFAASGQNINGIWKGKLVMEPGGCFPVYNIELQIKVIGSKITGNSYHYSDTSNFVKEVFEGMYDSAAKSMQIDENNVANFHIPADCIPCIKKYALSFHTDGTEEQLYLKLAEENIEILLKKLKPDFVFYIAGVDILNTDKYGKLRVSIDGCKKRDLLVFSSLKKNKIPCTVAMGGGYSSDVRIIVEAHCNTFRVAKELYGLN